MSTPTFATTHNLVAFLEKPVGSEGFEQIIDFLNASHVKYALTVNPTIYTSCMKQLWATAKVQKVNDQEQIQALVDKKKILISEDSIRRVLKLQDVECSKCLPNATIFKELERIGYEKLSQRLTFYKAYFSPQWKFKIHTILQCLSAKSTAWNEFSSTMASAIICLANNQKFNFSKYILDSMVKNLEVGVKFYMFPRFVQLFLNKQVEDLDRHKETYDVSSLSKKIFANMRRQADDFSRTIAPLFDTMMVEVSTEKKLKPRRRQRKETEDHVPTSFNDLLPSGEDSFDINELMVFCLSLQEQVFDLPIAKDAQAKEISSLKKTVKKLQRKRRSKPIGLRRMKKIGIRKNKSFKVTESLGAQEDSSKQGRKIEAINADDEVTREAQRQDDDLMFDTSVLEENEVVANHAKEPKVVSAHSGPTTTTDELTLTQTFIEIAKSKKAEAITTAATSVTTAVKKRPKTKGIVFHKIEQTRRQTISSQPSSKYKGKAIMIEPERPLKRKEQIAADEE
ncbi:hypothetical protein Tco_0020497 [Tanacetum coccineum]